jgi:phosphoglycerate dehydrogenase-like enzyme
MNSVAPPSGDRPKVVVTWPDYDVDGTNHGAALRAAGAEIVLAPKLGHRSPAALAELMADASAAIASTDPFDAQVLAACPRLRVIARLGVGVDSIDLEAATDRGVAVAVTPGANEGSTADHALALMLAVTRRVVEQDASVRRGEWNRTGRHMAGAFGGSTVGLVGFGRIGRLVARRLEGFDVELLACDTRPFEHPAVRQVELSELLRRSDIVSLHVPYAPGSGHLIGDAELALMRPQAVLVNAARGGILDESALAAALAEGRIRGAALDVFQTEPPPTDHPLLKLPNVVLSSHIGGLSESSVPEMSERATAAVVGALEGRAPKDLANPAVLAHPSWQPAPVPR